MIHIIELRLPINHAPEALPAAIVTRLGIAAHDLLKVEIFKRSYDARKNIALAFTYIVDVVVKDEAEVLKRFVDDPQVRLTPDTSYHFVAQVTDQTHRPALRPVVIGFGPCGIFAALFFHNFAPLNIKNNSWPKPPKKNVLFVNAQKATSMFCLPA